MSLPPSLPQDLSPSPQLPPFPDPASAEAPSSEANTRNVPCSPVTFAPSREANTLNAPCSPTIFSPSGEANARGGTCSPIIFNPEFDA